MQPIDVPEKRKIAVLHTTTDSDFQLLEKFSSFALLQRVLAYCLRFYDTTHHKLKRLGSLTSDVLKQTHGRIIGLLQRLAFAKEIRDLSTGHESSGKNRLAALSPF